MRPPSCPLTHVCAQGSGAVRESGSFTADTVASRKIRMLYWRPDYCIVLADANCSTAPAESSSSLPAGPGHRAAPRLRPSHTWLTRIPGLSIASHSPTPWASIASLTTRVRIRVARVVAAGSVRAGGRPPSRRRRSLMLTLGPLGRSCVPASRARGHAAGGPTHHVARAWLACPLYEHLPARATC